MSYSSFSLHKNGIHGLPNSLWKGVLRTIFASVVGMVFFMNSVVCAVEDPTNLGTKMYEINLENQSTTTRQIISPDGKYIVYSIMSNGGVSRCVTYQKQINDSSLSIGVPFLDRDFSMMDSPEGAISPDGKYFLYAVRNSSRHSGEMYTEIYKKNIEDDNPTDLGDKVIEYPLVDISVTNIPQFSYDGKFYLYLVKNTVTSNDNLWYYNVYRKSVENDTLGGDELIGNFAVAAGNIYYAKISLLSNENSYIYSSLDTNSLNPGYKFYKKSIVSEINNVGAYLFETTFIGSQNGQISANGRWYIYLNTVDVSSDTIKYGVYKKRLDDPNSEPEIFLNGDIFGNNVGNIYGLPTPDGKYYIYSIRDASNTRHFQIYKKRLDDNTSSPGVKLVDRTIPNIFGYPESGVITPDSKYYMYRGALDTYTGLYDHSLFKKRIDANDDSPGTRFLDGIYGDFSIKNFSPDGKYYIHSVIKSNYPTSGQRQYTYYKKPLDSSQDSTTGTTPITSNTCPADAICYTAPDPSTIVVAGSSTNVNTANIGDPITLATGESTYSNTFLQIPGSTLPYTFSLANRSQVTYDGPVGANWDHNYNIFLQQDGQGGYILRDGKLGVYSFATTSGSTDTFTNAATNAALKATLKKSTDNLTLTFQDGKEYVFGESLHITRITDKDQNSLTFAYDTNNTLTSVTDSLGNTVSYTYDDAKRLVKVSAPHDRSVILSYYSDTDSAGDARDIKSVTIQNNTNTSLNSSEANPSSSQEDNQITQQNSKTITFSYSKNTTTSSLAHNLVSFTDAKGQVYVENTYDANDRVSSQKYGDGTIHYTYTLDSTGKKVTKTTVTNKRGTVTDYTYDSNGNTLSMTVKGKNASNNVSTSTSSNTSEDTTQDITYAYTYDTQGHLLTEILPLGNGTAYQYDANGNRTEIRKKADISKPNDDTKDQVTRITYNALADVTSITDPGQTTTSVTYDDHRHPVKIQKNNILLSQTGSPKTLTSILTYDEKGRLVTTTDPTGRTVSYAYDVNGFLTKITKGTGDEASVQTFTYDVFGNPLTEMDAEGNTKTFTYDAFGNLASSLTAEGIQKRIITDANNNKVRTEHFSDSGKKLIQTNEYNLLDELIKTTLSTDEENTRSTILSRDADGNILSMQTPSGLITNYTYDRFERVTEKQDILGVSSQGNTPQIVTTKYFYDANGNLIQTLAPNGAVTAFAYDGFDRLIRTTDGFDTKQEYVYDAMNHITAASTTDKTSKILSQVSIEYSGIGKPLVQKTIDPITGVVHQKVFAYDENGNLLSQTDAKNNKTTYVYDSQNRLSTVKDVLGNKITITYDKNGRELRRMGEEGNGKTISTTTFAYDRDGRNISQTNILGKTKRFVYNSENLVTESTDEAGNKTTYEYDLFGNTIAMVDATGARTSLTYDTSNRITSMTDANGNKTTYEYDALGHKTKETLPDGSVTTYAYDVLGNLASYQDPNGSIITNTYDSLSRLVNRDIVRGNTLSGVGNEKYEYDALGRLIAASDDTGNHLSFTYDAFGNLTTETQGGVQLSGTQTPGTSQALQDKTTSYTYDANANIQSLLYPSGKQVQRTFDAANRLVAITTPDVRTKQVRTDNTHADARHTAQQASDTIATYSYDSVLLNAISLGNGTKTNYTYDTLLRLKSLSNLTSSDKRHPNGEGIDIFSYAYDDNGNMTADGDKKYVYDPLSRLTGITDGPQDAIDTRTQANNPYNTNISGSNHSTNSLSQTDSDTFSYDPLGNRTNAISKTTTSITVPVCEIQIVNRKKKTVCHNETRTSDSIRSSQAYDTNVLNQYRQITTSGSISTHIPSLVELLSKGKKQEHKETFTYDKNGNLTSDKDFTYTYDYRNRLVEIRTKGRNFLVEKYSYDPLGRRTKVETQTKLTSYAYAGQDAIEENIFVLDVLNKNTPIPKETKEYIYGAGGMDDVIALDRTQYKRDWRKELIDRLTSLEGDIHGDYKNRGGHEDDKDYQDDQKNTDPKSKTIVTRYFFHKNHLGSVTAITDEHGKVVEQYVYDAFGKVSLVNANGNLHGDKYFSNEGILPTNGVFFSKIGNTRLYTGREYSTNTGLYYLRARFYDPQTGRFLQRDPIGTRDQINLYTYVANNPIGYVDRMGAEKVALAITEVTEAYTKILTQSLGKISPYTIYNYTEKLTKSEYDIYDNFYPWELYQVSNNRDLARNNPDYLAALDATYNDATYQTIINSMPGSNQDKKSDLMLNIYGWNADNNTYADALRHSYFNALNAQDFGLDMAKQMGDAHEFMDNNYGHTVIMDLYNNSIGRSIYKANSNASDDQLREYIKSSSNLLIFGYGKSDTSVLWQGNDVYSYVVSKVRINIQNQWIIPMRDIYFN